MSRRKSFYQLFLYLIAIVLGVYFLVQAGSVTGKKQVSPPPAGSVANHEITQQDVEQAVNAAVKKEEEND